MKDFVDFGFGTISLPAPRTPEGKKRRVWEILAARTGGPVKFTISE